MPVAVLQGIQEMVKTNMDLARRTLENQERVQSSKKLRDSALSSLTNHQRRLMKLCFLHLKDGYDRWTLCLDDVPLSSTFKDLVEKKDNSSILNQLESLTSCYNCRPNKTLWLKFIKTDGFLGPVGSSLGGFSVFMFIPG